MAHAGIGLPRKKRHKRSVPGFCTAHAAGHAIDPRTEPSTLDRLRWRPTVGKRLALL